MSIKKIRKYYFIPTVIILLFIFMIVALKKAPNTKTEKDVANATENVLGGSSFKFPEIEEIDIFGRLRNSKEFIGKYVYVQFFKRKSQDNIAVIDKTLQKYKTFSDFAILYIFQADDNVKTVLFPSENEIAISNNYDKYVDLFKAPECCDSVYIFDKTGNMLSGKYYYSNIDTINGLLMEYYEHDKFIINKYVSLDENKENLIKPIVNIVKQSEENKFIIHMSTRVCASCKSGYIIEELIKLNKAIKKNNNIIFLIVKNLNENDINNLKKHLNIEYSIIGTDKETEAIWDGLIYKYGQKYLVENVFVINKKGEVLSHMEYDCNCDAQYLKSLAEIINNE